MFFAEVTIMLERINGFSLSRFTAAAGVLLATLAGCDRSEPSLYGFVDVVPSGVRQTACEAAPSGELRLDGMQAGDVVTISADELCHSWIVRKELPAGLYTASWQASGDAGNAHGVLGARWEARDPVIVNVFPEQTTTLRVYRGEPDPELLCEMSIGEAAELAAQ